VIGWIRLPSCRIAEQCTPVSLRVSRTATISGDTPGLTISAGNCQEIPPPSSPRRQTSAMNGDSGIVMQPVAPVFSPSVPHRWTHRQLYGPPGGRGVAFKSESRDYDWTAAGTHPAPGTATATLGEQVPGVRVVSLVGDLSSGRPLVEQVSPQAPSGRSAAPDAGLATEVAALAALLAEMVQFTGRAAIFPGEWEALADQTREHHSVRTAPLATQQDTP